MAAFLKIFGTWILVIGVGLAFFVSTAVDVFQGMHPTGLGYVAQIKYGFDILRNTLYVFIVPAIYLAYSLARRDIRIREMKDKLKSLTESNPVPTMICTPKGMIVDINQSAINEFHSTKKEILGKIIFDLFALPDDRQKVMGAIHNDIALKDLEMYMNKMDGMTMWVQISVTTININDRKLVMIGFSDVTKRKELEQKLEGNAMNLERMVEERTAKLSEQAIELEQRAEDLEKARIAADEANEAKSKFLANMSHELRTPLNAIIGYGELLLEEAVADKLEVYETDIKKILSAGKHLLSVINDILDLSKIEAGKMDVFIEDFSIADLVADVEAIITPLVQKKSNVLKIECAPDVGRMTSDITKVRQNLFNLLSNASKFSENGVVTLAIDKFYDNGRQWVRLAVTDTGIGMTPEQLGKMFQSFSQADASTTRKYGGTGLGLAITKRFCELLGGSVGVTSEYGKGSTFTIILPVDGTQIAVSGAA